ncbi:Vgb family protein [Nocardia crassostreae]|uniref:Vgb family protein n=1 Tax=Nocardia crassostreae TaxID=53428 RepID=UPI000836D5AE|nr:hypothetical protein [Nocardia crassostreae]
MALGLLRRSAAIVTLTLVLGGTATAAPPQAADPAAAVTQIQVGFASFAERFTAGPDGGLWFTLPPADIGRLDTTTLQLERIPAGGLLPGTTGITTGPDGAVWFSTLLGGYLGRIDPSTREITRYPLPHPLAGGHELVVGADGALWYPEFVTNRVGRFEPATGESTEYALPHTFPSQNPIMAAGPDGALWVTAPAPPSRIVKITTDGRVTEMNVPVQSIPFGLATGPDGRMWATLGAGQYGRGQLIAIDPATMTIARRFEVGLASGALPFSVGSFPAYINTGPDGNLWITSHLFGWIARITPPDGAIPGRTCATVRSPR